MRFGWQPAPNIAAESNAEMKGYDSLGPLAREAIGNSQRIVDIAKVIHKYMQDRDDMNDDGMFPPVNFLDPKTDTKLATLIDTVVRQGTGKPIAEHVLRPRRVIPQRRQYR